MTKALIVSPYLDHLGGGERYMLAAASVFQSLGYDLTFAWDDKEGIKDIARMLDIPLKDFAVNHALKSLYFKHSPLAYWQATRGYDLVFYLSDGSIPLLGGKRNILHMQVPFHGVGGSNLKNQLKKRTIHAVVVNSQFTKRIIDKEYGVDAQVIYPPVTLIKSAPAKKKYILSVGRFEPSLNTKRHDVLIDAFRVLVDSGKASGWSLVLLGGSGGNKAWVAELKKQATGLPVIWAVDAGHSELLQYYAESSIYWHAGGYQVDPELFPELTEHFGIAIVEAVSAGCVPFVIPRGGVTEIVSDPRLHWESQSELLAKTTSYMQNPASYKKIIANIPVKQFALARFTQDLLKLV